MGKLTFPSAGSPPKAAWDNFTVVDFYESKMSEDDSKFVFVPIGALQQLRGMIDPSTGTFDVVGPDGDLIADAVRDAVADAGARLRSITSRRRRLEDLFHAADGGVA